MMNLITLNSLSSTDISRGRRSCGSVQAFAPARTACVAQAFRAAGDTRLRVQHQITHRGPHLAGPILPESHTVSALQAAAHVAVGLELRGPVPEHARQSLVAELEKGGASKSV